MGFFDRGSLDREGSANRGINGVISLRLLATAIALLVGGSSLSGASPVAASTEWDPDLRLAFVRDCDVWVAHPSGAEMRNLTQDVPECALDVSMSGSGKTVVYETGLPAAPWFATWQVDLPSGAIERMGYSRGFDLAASSETVAFGDYQARAHNIYSSETDGTALRAWTNDTEDTAEFQGNFNPRWSDDDEVLTYSTSNGVPYCRLDRGGYDEIVTQWRLAVVTRSGGISALVSQENYSILAGQRNGGVLAFVRKPVPPAGGYCAFEPTADFEVVVSDREYPTDRADVSVSAAGDVAFSQNGSVVVLRKGATQPEVLFPGSNPDWGGTSPDRDLQERCLGAVLLPGLDAAVDEEFGSKKVRFTARSNIPGSALEFFPDDGSGAKRVDTGSFEHVYPKAGEYTPRLQMTTPAGCTASASVPVTADPVTTYAPTLYFHPKETYFPDKANTFLERSQLVVWRDKKCGGKKYLAAGSQARAAGKKQDRLASARLSGRAGGGPYVAGKWKMKSRKRAPSVCVKVDGKARSNGSPTKEFVLRHNDKWPTSSGFYLNLLNKPAWRKGSLDRARVYAKYVPGKYVAYWFFSPYNLWNANGIDEIHEGDWEHIAVRLDKSNRAYLSAFYQHTCKPKVYAWAKTAAERDPDSLNPASRPTHPYVFPALGGHASYPGDPQEVGADEKVRNCSLDIFKKVPDIGVQLLRRLADDRIGKGKAWRPWQDRQLTDVENQAWYGFGGAWGDRSSKSFKKLTGLLDNYGPPAPGPKNVSVPKAWE